MSRFSPIELQPAASLAKLELRTAVFATLAQRAPLLQTQLCHAVEQILNSFGAQLTPAEVTQCETAVLAEIEKLVVPLRAAEFQFETYPMTSAHAVAEHAAARLQSDLASAFERARLKAALTRAEQREILRGMWRTRYLDARLKKFFGSSEVKLPDGTAFQGKGFRSMGQEAIYAAAIRLRRGAAYQSSEQYEGDYVAPMIRDLGLALAMGQQPYDVMAAQMGKSGKPTNGKDLHIGDFACGVLPPAAPITLSTGSACGIGFGLKGTGRVMISCIGEGGSSSGEWHEVVNFAAVQNMPIVFIVQNNQTALSTPVHEQCAAFNFAQKALGYGMPSFTLDGTDPDEIFAAVTEAAEACRVGNGPVLLELVAMRMCGHAHHDDMLYLGAEPQQFLKYVENPQGGYVDKEKYAYWSQKDPIALYQQKLIDNGVIAWEEVHDMTRAIDDEMEQAAQAVIAAPWPEAKLAGHPVVSDGPWLAQEERVLSLSKPEARRALEPSGVSFASNGKTFWQAIVEALVEEMRRDTSTFMLGEDIGGQYGNAFVLLKSMLEEFGERMINTPLAEAAIIGCATGAALLGKRPIAEIQFNDFVASGFNQLVNNAAKIFYRWGQPVPMTIRLPWGGLRHAGPYHSQNTEAWFYRTPGLKIVCPSTPREAKGLLKAAIRDDNPVLYYEHIALYRHAAIKQHLPSAEEDFLIPIGSAHLKREGRDLTMITYGAYVHRCLSVAQKLEEEHGFSCQVLDLRTLLPLDKATILACVRETNRVLIVHEDSKSGGIGQAIASIIAEEAFEALDAPVVVLGALDAPVPYSPTLEPAFLVSDEQIAAAARKVCAY